MAATMNTHARRRKAGAAGLAAVPLLALLGGCGPRQFEAQAVIPQPLVTRIPVVVGVYMPAEFREAVHREEHDGVDYEITIGKSQSAGFERLLGAMFERVVPVTAPHAGAATDPAIRGVLEPVLEDFSFSTPQDTGVGEYAVSLVYRINAYTPTGQPVDSWTFTGYGAQPEGSLPGTGSGPLQKAAAIAMRDAGAKLAVEFRDQAIARGLIEAQPATPAPAASQPPP
jgi:hypothetical protein